MEKTELHEILTLNRVFAVAPEMVWRAWIDADALRVWFGQSEAPGWEALQPEEESLLQIRCRCSKRRSFGTMSGCRSGHVLDIAGPPRY